MSAPEKKTYLLGYPIAHSLSPALHNSVYKALGLPWVYELFESKTIHPFLYNLFDPTFAGSAVTMPFKVAIIPFLDGLTPQGLAVGSVNAIFFCSEAEAAEKYNDGNGACQSLWKKGKEGLKGLKLIGTNTDCIGIRDAILYNCEKSMLAKIQGGGRTGMIVGGGGTSRAAIYALRTWLGCEEIYFVNRDRLEVDTVIAECEAKGFGKGLKWVGTVDEVQTLTAPDVVVSAVPDFEPVTDDEIRARKTVEALLAKSKDDKVLLEMCYHPSSETRIKALAVREGWQVIDGTAAMIWQGLEQDRYWTGKNIYDLDVEKIKADTFANDHRV